MEAGKHAPEAKAPYFPPGLRFWLCGPPVGGLIHSVDIPSSASCNFSVRTGAGQSYTSLAPSHFLWAPSLSTSKTAPLTVRHLIAGSC